MSELLFNSIDAHAADERSAGRWDVSSVLISAKREIESLRTQLAAAETRVRELEQARDSALAKFMEYED